MQFQQRQLHPLIGPRLKVERVSSLIAAARAQKLPHPCEDPGANSVACAGMRAPGEIGFHAVGARECYARVGRAVAHIAVVTPFGRHD